MKSLLMFFGSCGHVDVLEVSAEQWQEAVDRTPAGPLGDNYLKNRFKLGRKTRIVYVYPTRYFICLACMKAQDEENRREYDAWIANDPDGL